MSLINNNLYEEWLYFFYSPEIEIKKNIIEKKYLGDGKIKIIGKTPKDWSIQIIPLKTIDIRKLKYNLLIKKNNLRYLIEQSFVDGNKNEFQRIKKDIEKNEKKISDIEKILEENNKKIKDSIKNTFNARRDLFVESLKGKQDKKKIKNLSENLEKRILEEIKLSKNIKEQEKNFVIRKQEILQEGPVPIAPKIKALTTSTRRRKIIFEESENENELKGGMFHIPSSIENDENDEIKIIYI